MTFKKNHSYRIMPVGSVPLDRDAIGASLALTGTLRERQRQGRTPPRFAIAFKGRMGQKEKLRTIPNWQER